MCTSFPTASIHYLWHVCWTNLDHWIQIPQGHCSLVKQHLIHAERVLCLKTHSYFLPVHTENSWSILLSLLATFQIWFSPLWWHWCKPEKVKKMYVLEFWAVHLVCSHLISWQCTLWLQIVPHFFKYFSNTLQVKYYCFIFF
jgi:hypothetical protein